MKHRSKGPSQRQLRVGELVRHALCDLIARGDARNPALDGALVSIAEVRMSPDLKIANVYVSPFGHDDAKSVISLLNMSAKPLRNRLGKEMATKFTPELRFYLDTRFEDDAKVDALLRTDVVQRDITVTDHGDH